MCTSVESYYSSAGMRLAEHARTVEAIRRKLVNPDVPDGKRERLCYELLRQSGSPQDRDLAEAQLRWIRRGCETQEIESRTLRQFFLGGRGNGSVRSDRRRSG